jgi:hypothetical protein
MNRARVSRASSITSRPLSRSASTSIPTSARAATIFSVLGTAVISTTAWDSRKPANVYFATRAASAPRSS